MYVDYLLLSIPLFPKILIYGGSLIVIPPQTWVHRNQNINFGEFSIPYLGHI